MVQLKLNLKSERPSTVYAQNGKSYRLLPGSNTLMLEYNDYVSLAKALNITPVKEDESNKCCEDNNGVCEKHDDSSKDIANENELNNKDAEQCESIKEECEQQTASEEQPSEVKKEAIDYSSWSFNKLKAEYKSITGQSCRLKKDEVIEFLQEHGNNA